jgi:hypothetical protein
MPRRTLAIAALTTLSLGCGASRPREDSATLASGNAQAAQGTTASSEPDPPGTMHQAEIAIAAPFPIVREVASDPTRYFGEVRDLGEVRVIAKTERDTDVYVASEMLRGTIHFFTVVRIRFTPDGDGMRLHGQSVRGNIGNVVVDAWVQPNGEECRFRLRIAVDPILPIPRNALHRSLGRVVRRTAAIVRRESEARARGEGSHAASR